MPLRTNKLIHWRLQLTLVGWFLAVSVSGLLLQFVLLGAFLTRFAASLPDQGPLVAEQVMGMLLSSLGLSLLFLVPLTLGVGILATFKLAGPLYRLETYLDGIARGEWEGPCKIRKGDALQEFCDKLNTAVSFLRAAPAVKESESLELVEGAERTAA